MSMQRSRTQVMFQFLPGNTFDYSNRRGIWQVTRLETSDVSGQLDTAYTMSRVKYRVRNWEGGYLGFDTFEPEFYHFGRPEGVQSKPFPLTFECNSCGKAHQYYSVDDLEGENLDLTCTSCGGRLTQYQFVSVHSCGNIEGLNVPGCTNGHGRQHIVLDTQGSQKATNFQWRCDVEGCSWSQPIAYRQQCDCDYDPEPEEEADEDGGDSMYTTVHRAGSVFYPHYLTTVNLRTAGMGQLRNSADGPLKGIASYLELSDAPIAEIDLDAQTDPEEFDDDRIVEVFQTVDEVGSLDEAEEWLRRQGELGSQTLRSRIGELLALSTGREDDEEDELGPASDELLQYGLSKQELTTAPLDQLATTARQRGFDRKADRINSYHDDLERLGLDATRIVEDFPIQTFVYGYTRGSRQNARIKPFPENSSDGNGTPVFVDTAETEGIQFDIDPAPVLLWLAVNFPETREEDAVNGPVSLPAVDDHSPDGLRRGREAIDAMDRDEQRAFILNHLPGVDDYGRFDTSMPDTLQGEITEYLFKLQHTMSHVLLKQASTISGFDRTNLSEFLFPRALSFVIYANNRNEFNMGGMNTMVEQQLDNLLGQAEAYGNDCVYDPVCSQRGGACLSCLHVSEISCSYFNQVLSRDYLFGSRAGTGRDITGFWEVARY